MIAKIVFFACVALTLSADAEYKTFNDLYHILEVKTNAAGVIITYTKDGIEKQVLNYEILARIEFIALEGLVLEHWDNSACIGAARFLLWELETGAINNSRAICKINQVNDLNKSLEDLKLFVNDINEAVDICKDDQECEKQSVGNLSNKLNNLMKVFETKPGEITKNVLNCYVDLYSTHMVMRTDEAKQNLLKCVKN